MKTPAKTYFAFLTVLNLLLTFGMYSWSNVLSYAFDQMLEGKSLPPAAQLSLTHPWWPVLFALLFGAAWYAAKNDKVSARPQFHILAGGLIAEALILFLCMLFTALPFVPMQSRFIP